MASEVSGRSRTVALLLAGVLGVFGAHRFYAGRTQSGVLMAVTLGGCGLWWLYDLVIVAAGEFRDVDGRVISDWEPQYGGQSQIPLEVLHELDQLRREVLELHDRVDFTERLLAARVPEKPGEGASGS